MLATYEYRGAGAAERTEYHNTVAFDRLAEICGKFLSKGQLVDLDGRLCLSSLHPMNSNGSARLTSMTTTVETRSTP